MDASEILKFSGAEISFTYNVFTSLETVASPLACPDASLVNVSIRLASLQSLLVYTPNTAPASEYCAVAETSGSVESFTISY